MIKKSNFSSFQTLRLSLVTAVSVLALSACSGGGAKQKTDLSTSMNPKLKTTAIDRAMEKALAQAQASGNAQEILAMLAQVNARNPDDAIVATRYGRALREDDQINASIRTLTPFTKGANKNVEAITEMAMAQIALGDFNAAENYAQTATQMNDKNARAYLALGTAQDALERHQDAEISFRAGLKNWKGDPTPILNNLALNLASQGHLNESLSLLEKALKISPNRMDLERNRRIIATLVETTGPTPPAPSDKPQATQKVKPMGVTVPDTAMKTTEPVPKKKPSQQDVEKTEAPQNIIAEQKKPSPPPQVEEANMSDDSTEVTPVDITAPKTTLKNISLKKKDSYN